MNLLPKYILGIFLSLSSVMSSLASAGEREPLENENFPADDGAGSSGGGFTIRDNSNPWWVQNTASVRYCVDIDPNAFSLSREFAEVRIAKALELWKREFKSIQQDDSWLMKPNDQILVATQTFIKVSCDEQVELRFQLGHLSKAQALLLPASKSVVGIAMRTHYDLRRLSGNGFVYLAPDLGANRNPSFPKTYNPWEEGEGALFYLAILHELGHVFGVPDVTDDTSFMDENWVDRYTTVPVETVPVVVALVNEADAKGGLHLAMFQIKDEDFGATYCYGTAPKSSVRFPGMKRSLRRIASSGFIGKYLGADIKVAAETQQKCERTSFRNGQFILEQGPEDAFVTVGVAQMKKVGERQLSNLVTLWLPTEHTNFFKASPDALTFNHRFAIAGQKVQEYLGVFNSSTTGKTTEISFEIGPEDVPKIRAVVNGHLMLDLYSGH